jgi:uncharacterized membrane protein
VIAAGRALQVAGWVMVLLSGWLKGGEDASAALVLTLLIAGIAVVVLGTVAVSQGKARRRSSVDS